MTFGQFKSAYIGFGSGYNEKDIEII